MPKHGHCIEQYLKHRSITFMAQTVWKLAAQCSSNSTSWQTQTCRECSWNKRCWKFHQL